MVNGLNHSNSTMFKSFWEMRTGICKLKYDTLQLLDLFYKQNNPFCPYLASSLSDIGIPLRRQKTSIGESPDASQIKFAFSPFLTDSRTVFSSKLGGAKTKLNRIIFPSIMFQTSRHSYILCIYTLHL